MKSNLFKILILIPLIQIVLDSLMILFPAFKSEIGILRLIIVSGIILYITINVNLFKSSTNKFLLFYSLYILILCSFSSDLSESLIDGFIKLFISLMMFPIGVLIGNNDNRSIIRIAFWMLLLLIVNYGLAQYLKLGNSLYEEDTFYSGGATATTPIIIALCVLVLLNGLNTKRLAYNQLLNIFVLSISIFIVLLSLKRGAILAMGVGLVFYFLFSTNRKFLSLRMFAVGIGLILFFSQYSASFNQRLDARTTEKNNLENENRYKETFFIINELNQAPLINLVFGDEAFNSKKVLKKYFKRERQLHVDYNVLLHGTGILGLILYLILFFRFLSISRSYKIMANKFIIDKNATRIVNENHALIIAMVVLCLAMSFSGGLQFSSYRIILFLFLGYFLGQSQKIILKMQLYKQEERNNENL